MSTNKFSNNKKFPGGKGEKPALPKGLSKEVANDEEPALSKDLSKEVKKPLVEFLFSMDRGVL